MKGDDRMENITKEGEYTNPSFKDGFDYCLFRKGFEGSESLCFNENELNVVLSMIEKEEIAIHPKYTVLYSRSRRPLCIFETVGIRVVRLEEKK